MAYDGPFPITLADGGTSASLTASNGGIFYSTASAGAILAGTATAHQLLLSGASTTPLWSTSTYPTTNAVNTLLYASSANVMSALATGNNGVLITSSSGVPSWLAGGTTGQVLTATTGSPPTWASAGGGSITLTGDSGGGLTGSSFTITGGTTGLTFAGAGTTLTLGGTLAIADGGTDATSFGTTHGIVVYNGTSLVNYAGPQISTAGVATNTAQPAFFAYISANTGNVTGDATTYTVAYNEVLYDNASNFNTGTYTFTAPVTGIYHFDVVYFIYNLGAAHNGMSTGIQTTAQDYPIAVGNPYIMSTSTEYQCTYSLNTKMTAGNTAFVTIEVSGSTKTVGAAGTLVGMSFSGYLVC